MADWSDIDANVGQTDYPTKLDTLRTRSEAVATEVENARNGEANLITHLNLKHNTADIWQAQSYTVGTLPSAATYIRGIIYVSDEVGGPTLAFSDGTNWRRVQDRAIVT